MRLTSKGGAGLFTVGATLAGTPRVLPSRLMNLRAVRLTCLDLQQAHLLPKEIDLQAEHDGLDQENHADPTSNRDALARRPALRVSTRHKTFGRIGLCFRSLCAE